MLSSYLITLLTSNALTAKRNNSIYNSRITILNLSLIVYTLYHNFNLVSLSYGIGIYGGLLNVSTFTNSFNLLIFILTIVILSLSAFYPRKIEISKINSSYNPFFNKLLYNKDTISNKIGEQFNIIEYSLIIIFILSGAVFLISSSDLISVFLSIELQSYGLYILSTIYRDSEQATGSGLIYFLLGGLSSCFILLGSALLYNISGTTSLDNIYLMINIAEDNISQTLPSNYSYEILQDNVNLSRLYDIQLSIIIMIVGFLFKISAAPFHFWSPDVYDGIPTIVTTFVAIITKISIFGFLLEFVYFTKSNAFDFSWTNILILSSLLSLIIGSVLGITQFRIKRLYAYSTISHVGFILLGLSINTIESIQSYIFYILQYSISNLNAFIILLTIGYSLYLYVYKYDLKGKMLLDQNNSPIQLVDQIRGYFYINSFLSISLCITIFSFVGIPPIIGFFGKQMILSAALDKGYTFLSLVGILTSVIGASYYLNLVKEMFFFKPKVKMSSSLENEISNNNYNNYNSISLNEGFKDKLEISLISHNTLKENINEESNNLKILVNPNNITISSSLSISISIMTLLILLFIYTPDIWLNSVNLLALNIFKV